MDILTIILFPLGLFIGLSFIWIPAFFKGNKYSSIDKIEELDLIVEAFNCYIIINSDKAWKKVNKVKQLKEKYIELLKKEING